jgi:ferredoxin
VADAQRSTEDFVEKRAQAIGFAPEMEPEPVSVNTETTFKVSFARSNREIECGSGQQVLDAAKKAGVRLPASCTQGMCGTCKVKLVSGEVAMKHAGGIRQREIDQGMVLLCCSKPLTDLVVDK